MLGLIFQSTIIFMPKSLSTSNIGKLKIKIVKKKIYGVMNFINVIFLGGSVMVHVRIVGHFTEWLSVP